MNGLADIADVFGIFHDGVIVAPLADHDDGEIVVWIPYLASRTSSGGDSFKVRFDGLEQVSFIPWEEEGQPVLPVITGFTAIFPLELEILSAEVRGDLVAMACSCRGIECFGGNLEIIANGCRVHDESGREWGLEELKKLAEGYWEEWSSRGRK